MVSTSGRGGHPLTKRFRLYTNDPRQAHAVLTITGKVDGYVDIQPSRVRLVGRLGETLTAQVRIVPKEQYPFTIQKARSRNGQHIRITLEPEAGKRAEKAYLLTVTSTKTESGSFGDYIVLQTDLKEKPTIGIPVSGHLYSKPSQEK